MGGTPRTLFCPDLGLRGQYAGWLTWLCAFAAFGLRL